MNILYLKYAIEIQKTGSITRAAENLFMGQPNLSKAIKDLETEIGFSIFQRTSKGVTPTTKGLIFLNSAKSITDQIEALENRYRVENKKESMNICVCDDEFFKRVTKEFFLRTELIDKPKIKLSFETNKNIMEFVSKSDFRIGIIKYPSANENEMYTLLRSRGIFIEPIAEFDMMVVMSNELYKKTGMAPDSFELSKYTEIISDASDYRISTDIIHINDRSICFEILQKTKYTFMQTKELPNELKNNENIISVPYKKYKYAIIQKTSYSPSELERKYIELVTEFSHKG